MLSVLFCGSAVPYFVLFESALQPDCAFFFTGDRGDALGGGDEACASVFLTPGRDRTHLPLDLPICFHRPELMLSPSSVVACFRYSARLGNMLTGLSPVYQPPRRRTRFYVLSAALSCLFPSQPESPNFPYSFLPARAHLPCRSPARSRRSRDVILLLGNYSRSFLNA
jgi:hypothetical protein